MRASIIRYSQQTKYSSTSADYEDNNAVSHGMCDHCPLQSSLQWCFAKHQNTIQPTRGLRQGDPLSPYLFLFVADGLSKLLQQGNRAGAIQGLKVCRNALVVSHLLFADDNLLFFRADEEQSQTVKEVLSRYCKATGQLINFDKCSVLC